MLKLVQRALLRVGGVDAASFLQGLITKDVGSLRNPGVVYSLLLNVKGRIFSDLLIYKIPAVDAIILEADAARMPELERNLKIYRLRKQVELEPMNESIYFSTQLPSQESITNAFEDPRVPSFGYRIIGGELHFDDSFSLNDYTRRRLEWGIGEGYDELGDQIPLNVNGDIMNGIDFEKGCYIGQEMVARTHWTGVVRRRLLPFHCLDPAKTVEGINILDESKKRQGKILKSHGSVGISLVSISFAGRKLFDEAGNEILVYKPDWWPNDLK